MNYDSRVTPACLSPPFRSSQTGTATQVGNFQQARHNSVAQLFRHVVTHGTCAIKHSVPFISVGPVYHNALTCCAALSCRTLRKENHLCSSTVSDTANMRIHERSQAVSAEEKSSAVPLRSGHMSAICARLIPKRNGGRKSEGWKPWCPSLLCARGVSAVPFASQAKTQIASWKVREITSRCCSRLSL